MEKAKSEQNNWKVCSNKIPTRLAIWAGIYVLTAALAAFGPIFLWQANEWLTVAAILLNLGIGIGTLLVNIRYLKTLDELMQKIQLEASGIALGVGAIVGISYSLLDNTVSLTPFDAKISILILLITITYLIALLFGYRRYK